MRKAVKPCDMVRVLEEVDSLMHDSSVLFNKAIYIYIYIYIYVYIYIYIYILTFQSRLKEQLGLAILPFLIVY